MIKSLKGLLSENDLGQPVYNLEIKLNVNIQNFKTYQNSIEMIRDYGIAIDSAQRNLCGCKTVTESGYLLRQKTDNLPVIPAQLDIDDNMYTTDEFGGILTLDNLLQKRDHRYLPATKIRIHITYENGIIDNIYNNGPLLYLESMRYNYLATREREEAENKQNKGKTIKLFSINNRKI